jgi:hypothetical protein
MDALVSSAVNGPVARIPRPPAFETAATSGGVEIQDMPGNTMGCSHPKISVARVDIVRKPALAVAVVAERVLDAIMVLFDGKLEQE